MWPARRALAIGYLAFVKAIAIHGCRQYSRAIAAASGGDWWRTVRAPLAAVTIVTLLFSALPAATLSRSVNGNRALLTLWLVPQALAIGLPIGVAVGLLVGSDRRRSAALVSAIVLGASLANVAWAFPAANQAFRMSAAAPGLAGRPLARGVNELTLGELRSLLEPGTHEPMAVAQPATREGIAVAYYARWALTFATLVLALFVSAVRSRSSSRLAIAAGVVAASLGYYTLIVIGSTRAWPGTWPPVAGAWFANGVVALASLALVVTRRRQAAGQP